MTTLGPLTAFLESHMDKTLITVGRNITIGLGWTAVTKNEKAATSKGHETRGKLPDTNGEPALLLPRGKPVLDCTSPTQVSPSSSYLVTAVLFTMKSTNLITILAGLFISSQAAAATIPQDGQKVTFYRSVQPKQRDQQQDDNTPPPAEAAKAALDAMNTTFYSPTDGRWSPNDAWWVSGNAFQSLLDYMSKTGTRGSYMDQALQIFNTQRAPVPGWPQGEGEFRADSTDDTGWWALAMVRMFDLTGDQSYLNISMLDEAYISQYWSDSVCGGGVYVDIRALSYKNAIANQLYIQLCAALHNRIPGDTVYLEKAVRGWRWLRASGMVNNDGLFNDGLAMREDGTCFNNGLPVWIYNQGVILGAAAELYRATKDTSYLTFARQIADSVLSSKSLIQNDGILTESCETDPVGCNGDQQIFKGIFARNLADLDSLVEGKPYRSFLEANARTAYSNDRAGGGSDLYDVSWAGPYVASSLAKQAIVLSLWVALI